MSNGIDPFERASLITTHDEGNYAEAVVPPIFQTSLFTFSDYDDMIASYRGEKVRPIYTRGLNPTVRMFEEMLAKLEGAEDALGFASGMAAISSSVLSFVEPGDRIVAVNHVYPDAFRLFGTTPEADEGRGHLCRWPRRGGCRQGAARRQVVLHGKPDQLGDGGA
jgi:cystathionine beta-lyase/cystathionine gamma-synthase